MALKRYWLLIVAVLGTGLILIHALRPPTSRMTEFRRVTLERERERWAADRRVATYVTQYRMAVLTDSIRPVVSAKTEAPVRIVYAPQIPASLRKVIDSIVGEASKAVGTTRIGTDVVVVQDTARHVLSAVRSTDGFRSFDIPPADASQRCVHVIAVGRIVDGHFRDLRTDYAINQALGTCRYYAAFGMPGAVIRRWMREKGAVYASGGSWTIAPPSMNANPFTARPNGWFSIDHPALFYMSDDGMECMNTGGSICETILMRVPSTYAVVRAGPALAVRRAFGYSAFYGNEFGGREDQLLAGMVRGLGRDKFTQFWTSDDPVPTAFERPSGTPLRKWVASFLVDQYGSMRHGPRLKYLGVFNALLIIGLSVGVSVWLASRRQYS